MSESALGDLFRPHGNIQEVNLISDHYTRQSKCFGYVEMPDRIEGTSAMNVLNGTKINNRHLVVKEARPRGQRAGHAW